MPGLVTFKQAVVDAARRLSARGHLVATGGNLSVRIPGRAAMAVTPSNLDYAVMTADDVCVLDLDLGVIEGALKPSVESSLHAAVYQARPDVHAVVHTHQPYASALSLIDKPIPPLFDEQVRFLGRSVEIVPYGPSGTFMLRRQVARAVRSHANAFILGNHGVLCLGPDLRRAENNVELLEKCALTYLLALCTGEKIGKIPAWVREVAVMKLRADQRKATLAGAVAPETAT